MFYFAEDKCLLNVKDSIAKISRFVNKDLKLLQRWLNFNAIYMNGTKAEVMLFKPKDNPFDTELTLSGKKLVSFKFTKYLEIYVDEYLHWLLQTNKLNVKQFKVTPMICKIRPLSMKQH